MITSIKSPLVLRDYIQILQRVITITLNCVKRRPAFKDQIPLFYSKLCNKETTFPLRFVVYVKAYFHLIDCNFKFDDKIR